MTHAEFIALMREERPGFVRIETGGDLGAIYVTPETAREIFPLHAEPNAQRSSPERAKPSSNLGTTPSAAEALGSSCGDLNARDAQ